MSKPTASGAPALRPGHNPARERRRRFALRASSAAAHLVVVPGHMVAVALDRGRRRRCRAGGQRRTPHSQSGLPPRPAPHGARPPGHPLRPASDPNPPRRYNARVMKRSPDIAARALPPLLVEHRAALLALAERRGLRNVRVFGSMARGDHHAQSDVDLLVDALPGTSALALCGLSIDAGRLLDRPVDVVTERCLYAPMREQAVREAMPL